MTETEERAPPSKREARKQERHEAILAIAARSFLERGYAATSMSAIAAELGGSKGTLWNYFPSKEELFAAVLEDRTMAFRSAIETLLDPRDDLRSTLLRYCSSFIEKLTASDSIQLHRLVASEAERFPEVGRIFHEQAPRRTKMVLGRFLAEHMAAGHLRREDPEMAARALTNLCLGSHHQMLWGAPRPDAQEIEAEASFATETFLRAFAR
jgi:AcrR family transcriptional regulator